MQTSAVGDHFNACQTDHTRATLVKNACLNAHSNPSHLSRYDSQVFGSSTSNFDQLRGASAASAKTLVDEILLSSDEIIQNDLLKDDVDFRESFFTAQESY